MTEYGPAAVPPDEAFVAAVEAHYPHDDTLLGGVPVRTIADELEVHRDTARHHCKRLVDADRLVLIEARIGYTFAPAEIDSGTDS
ncbi:MAG: hypothetical protein ABEI57_05680 [Halapricum sp.]